MNKGLLATGSARELTRLCGRILQTAPLTVAGRQVALHHACVVRSDGWPEIREHVHSCYEAHFFLTGEVDYTVKRCQPVRPGGMVLHGPHVPHGFIPQSPYICFILFFHVHPVVEIPEPTSWPIRPICVEEVERLLGEAHEGGPGWRDRVQGRLMVLLSHLLALAQGAEVSNASGEEALALAARVDQFLRDNLARPLALGDIAAHVAMSERSLRRHYQAQTGRTVMATLLELRLEYAMHLLEEGNMPVAEAGRLAGLPDPCYFSRQFRRMFNRPPREVLSRTRIDNRA